MTGGFKPCPICGAELTLNNITYTDWEGVRIDMLDRMVDPEDPKSPANMESATGARFDKGEWNRREGYAGEYRDEVEAVGIVMISCPCGYALAVDYANFTTEPHPKKRFASKGWLDEFRDIVDRRSS